MTPDPDTIDIRDIAYVLSDEPRFGGHCWPRYYVAQHSVLVSRYVSPQNALAGLLHDASEAYLRDIPSPIKHAKGMEGYREIEAGLMAAVAKKFGFQYPLDKEVEEIDHRILVDEAAYFMGGMVIQSTEGGELKGLDLPFIHPWNSERCEAMFLSRFSELVGGA